MTNWMNDVIDRAWAATQEPHAAAVLLEMQQCKEIGGRRHYTVKTAPTDYQESRRLNPDGCGWYQQRLTNGRACNFCPPSKLSEIVGAVSTELAAAVVARNCAVVEV